MLCLYFEASLQRWYLDLPAMGLIRVWNIFYGTAHFVVTAGAILWLYRADKGRYPRWRNTLLVTTEVAIVGFASYSSIPTRDRKRTRPNSSHSCASSMTSTASNKHHRK